MKYKITMFITSLLGVASYFLPFFAFGSSISHFETCSFSGLNALIETKKVQWGNFLENGLSISLIKILGIIYAFIFIFCAIICWFKNKKLILTFAGLVNAGLLAGIITLLLNVPKLGTLAHPFVGFYIGAICSVILILNFIFAFFMIKKKPEEVNTNKVEDIKAEEPNKEENKEPEENSDSSAFM